MVLRLSARRVLSVLAVALMLCTGAATASSAAVVKPEPSRWIVALNAAVPDANSIAREHAALPGVQLHHVYNSALKGYAGEFTDDAIRAIKADPRVRFVQPDRQVRADGTQPIAPGDVAQPGIRRIESASTSTVHTAASVNVAVIDTGIDLTHPDLNAVDGVNCITPLAPALDDNGHGSHVSGTIGGRNDGHGVAGVAPNTSLYAVKVLSAAGIGLTSDIICGIDWVTQNSAALNIKVANMSLGGSGSSDNNCGNTNNDAEHLAICNSTNAGVTYAVAAGNSAKDLAGSLPAAYPEVLSVTAMTDSDGYPGGTGPAPSCRSGERDDTYASFSNYAVDAASAAHTIAAPGTCVYSTYRLGTYNTLSGTSMATPHVAGSLALCLSAGACPGTPAQVIGKLRSDAAAHAAQTAGYYGFVGSPSIVDSTGVNRYYGDLVWDGAY